MPSTPIDEKQQPTSSTPVNTEEDNHHWQKYDPKKWQESQNNDDEKEIVASSSRILLDSHWNRLGVILLFVVVTIIVVCSVRPFDRIVTVILPDLEWNETVAPVSPIISGSDLYSSATTISSTSSDREKSFSFRQCRPNATACCNGLENTCDLKVNQVMFATLHKAAAAQEDGALLRPNHLYSLESALDAGYRGLHLEVCKCNGAYQFCHQGICQLGARNPTEVFLNMDRFLRDHRQEVLLVHLELRSEVHQDVILSEVYDVMKNATRFHRYLYSQEDDDDNPTWPTLGAMLESNKRILLFHSRGPSCNSTSTTSEQQCPKGMHSWSDHVWESEALKGLGEKDWQQQSCSLTSAELSPGINPRDAVTPVVANNAFFSVNHFLAQPYPEISRELNEFDTVAKRMEDCSSQHAGLQVNLVSTDFWHLGSVVEFVQQQNKAKTSIV